MKMDLLDALRAIRVIERPFGDIAAVRILGPWEERGAARPFRQRIQIPTLPRALQYFFRNILPLYGKTESNFDVRSEYTRTRWRGGCGGRDPCPQSRQAALGSRLDQSNPGGPHT